MTMNKWMIVKGQNHVRTIWLQPLKPALSDPIPTVVVDEFESLPLPFFADELHHSIHIYHSVILNPHRKYVICKKMVLMT